MDWRERLLWAGAGILTGLVLIVWLRRAGP
jgi:hypothetical protein